MCIYVYRRTQYVDYGVTIHCSVVFMKGRIYEGMKRCIVFQILSHPAFYCYLSQLNY